MSYTKKSLLQYIKPSTIASLSKRNKSFFVALFVAMQKLTESVHISCQYLAPASYELILLVGSMHSQEPKDNLFMLQVVVLILAMHSIY